MTEIRHDDKRFDLAALMRADKATKPSDFDSHVAQLVSLYQDGPDAVAEILRYQKKLGLGLAESPMPLQHGILDYVVGRLSTRYSTPPTRALSLRGKALEEDTDQHQHMTGLLSSLHFDSVMSELDRYSNLCGGSVYVRVYPTRRGLRLRMFTPDLVMRVVSPELSDDIAEDSFIALRLSGGSYEVHIRDPDGRRSVKKVSKDGEVLPRPFEVYPEAYQDTLPIVRLDSKHLLGHPWGVPRLSRIGYVLGLSGMQSDLQALAAHQAHSMLVFQTGDPNRDPPAVNSPGVVAKIYSEDELRYETAQPLIDAVQETANALLKVFLLGERIPPNDLSGTSLTGAALKVLERPLRSHRVAGAALAANFERDIWRVIGVLHNAHFSDFDLIGLDFEPREIDLSLALTTRLGPQEAPVDDGEILSNGAKGMALGIDSAVSVAMRLHACSRARAIEIIDQAREDMKAYPPPSSQGAEQVDRGEAADVVAAANGNSSGDSVVDAAQGNNAGDARSQRRG